MNRPIKFRVWDVQQNKFLPSYGDLGIQFYHEQGKDWHEKQVRDIVPVSWFLQDHNNNLGNYIIQQYTGLTDKNGKEIYEGDIIIDTQKQKYEIIFYENYARYDLKVCGENKLSQTSYFTQIYEKKHIEVIGNIFETPQLLK